MHRGFIPLYRKLKDNWVYTDNNTLASWIKVLIECNHKDKKTLIEGDLIECKRGQSINSLSTWSIIFGKGWTIQKVRTFFKLLEKDKMISIKGLRKTTRLTVCNYESYNSSQQRDNTEVTQRQQRDNNEVTTNNNDNNENNEKNVNKEPLKKPAKQIVNPFKKWTTEEFTEDIKKHGEEYSPSMKNDFFKYWTEPDSKGKMLFQLKKTWETSRRLSTWYSRSAK